MKHIVFISGTIDDAVCEASGGVSRVFSLVCSRLAENDNFDVGILSLFSGIRGSHFAFNQRVHHSHLQTKLIHRSSFNVLKKSLFWGVVSIKLVGYVRRLIATSEEEVTLVSATPFVSLFLIFMKFFFKFQLIIWELASFSVYSPLLTAVRRWLYRYADEVVVCAIPDFEYLSSYKVKCKLIYHPIDFSTIGVVTKNGSKSSFNDRPVLLAAGRLVPQKGFDRLVDVIDILVNRLSQKNFKLLIVGSGPDKDRISRSIIEKDLSSFIELVQFTPAIERYYAGADIFVLTSRFEGLPMVLLETQAYGVPAVAFDCLTGPREVIVNDQNGYLIVDGDSTEFAKALDHLIIRPNERQRLSVGALVAAKQFDIEGVMAKWFQLVS